MNIQLSFNEILDYVKQAYNVEPTITTIDNRTIRVTYKMNLISLDLHIDGISRDLVNISYSCSNAISYILNGFILLMGKKIPQDVVEILTDDKKIRIHLDAIKQLEKVLEFVVPTNIFFAEDSLNVRLTPQYEALK